MTARPRQIVLDKSAFDGIKIDALCEFAKSHFLLVSEVLLYESMTSQKFKGRQLLSRSRDLLQAGASYCSRTEDLIRWEGKHSRPFPPLLADSEKTRRLREGPVKADHAFSDDEIAAKQRIGLEFAKAFLVDTIRRLTDSGRDSYSEVLPDHTVLPQDARARLAAFAEIADSVSFTSLALTHVPKDWVTDEKKFCLSAEWITWQH